MKTFIFILFLIPSLVFTQTKKIKIKNHILTVEIAKTPSQRQKGLMFRKKLKKNHGMLFIFPKAQILSFWMKNTFIPLSIAFFDKNKKLINIEKMTPNQTRYTYESKEKAIYALEVNWNWFEDRNITKGDSFIILK